MKILSNGVAVIDGDTHISAWVIEHGKLAIAEEMLTPFAQYVPVGGTVIDVGASIGDHTVTYAQWVGVDGMVAAFEPHAESYECLCHNTDNLKQVLPINSALSDSEESASIVCLSNAGASYLDPDGGDVPTLLLDNFEFKDVSFIKIDAEGYETKVLRGAVETINNSRPVMLIEVNRAALLRAGSSPEELREMVTWLDYNFVITDNRIPWSDPQFDILCLPNKKDQ